MKRIYLGLFCCCVLFSTQSFPQTWNGSVSSDWTIAANWTPNNVPTTSGNVVINNASALNHPVLPSDVSIRTLNLSAGFLNLNGFTLTCTVSATLTGDSLYNGKISSATFNDLANMHMGGKIILERTGSANEWWEGKNKFYGDSLIVIWRSGSLYMENGASSPDSIFGNLKLVYGDNNSAVYRINVAVKSQLYVQKDLLLDNPDKGTFGLDYSNEKIIGGNIKATNFSNAVPNLPLSNVTVLGPAANGPFYCHTASINDCNIHGDFTLVADSNVTIGIYHSSFLGANNLLQAGSLDLQNNRFGQPEIGTTTLKAAHNVGANVFMRDGNNRFLGNVNWETYAVYPGALIIQNTFYGADSCWGNMNFILKGNAALVSNMNGNNYVAGNVIIDGQEHCKWIEFDGGAGVSMTIGGNFTVKNFSPTTEPGLPPGTTTNVHLRNISSGGTDTCGTFYCFTGDITNCSFNGGLKLIADSSQTYTVSNSSLRGANNLIRSGGLVIAASQFGNPGIGTTSLQALYNGPGAAYLRDGNNKFFGNLNVEGYAMAPGGTTIHHTYLGQDTCLGDLNFVLKGNVALISNMNGNSYVGGNITIDGQGHRKYVEFTGPAGVSLTVGGNFTVKNFAPSAEPGVDHTNVHLRNITASGADTCGTFYCYTGDINNCVFNGNFNLVGDSSQVYYIWNSSFGGANNLFQSGNLDFQHNQFGQPVNSHTIFRASYNGPGGPYMRDGSNKFFGNTTFETYAVWPGGVTIQQSYYGQDSCLGNLNFNLKGNASLVSNFNGNNYVSGDLVIDGYGARKWVQFSGGTGNTFKIDGNFTVKNFTPSQETGVTSTTNVLLRNITAAGTDTCGTFYCLTGDISGCNFNGNFKLIADSSYTYWIDNSSFRGANNLFQSGSLDIKNSQFGQTTTGNTIFKATYDEGGGPFMRDGKNKFFGDVNFETYAVYPGGVTIENTYYGADTCFANMNFILKGNASLLSNIVGNNYVAGNLTIDAQGARKWIQFSGGDAVSLRVDGNFTAKNFSPTAEPGFPPGTTTNVFLRNITSAGTDTCGTFYCFTGDITNCSFSGGLKLISDSSQPYYINKSALLGADNLFRSGNLDILNSKFGRTGIGTTVLDVAHNVGAGVYVRDGGNKFLGDLQWNAIAPSYGSILVQESYYGTDTCLGDFTLNISGLCSANLAGNNLYLGKGFALQNNGTGIIVQDNISSAIHFIGNDTANYSFSGTGSLPSFTNFEMNRRGGLRLLSPISYSGTLTFTRGIILSSASHLLQVPNGAAVASSWDSSYVDGPVKKTGNSNFTFPLGSNNSYAPLAISAPFSTTDAFTAQYFNHIAHIDGYDTTKHDVSLNHLSRKEYWTLDRTAGSSNLNVTLSWKTLRSGNVTSLPELRVAHWNGTSWSDEGNGGTTGNVSEGTIQSQNTITSFSPFTLASIGPSNPLPVRFVSFDARLNANRTVLLQWTTTSEINNDHFEIERSTDFVNWTTIKIVNAGSNHNYSYVDINPSEGYNYYRIKQVDFNGNYSLTETRKLLVQGITGIVMRPNPVVNDLNLLLPCSSGVIEIATESGAVLIKKSITTNQMIIPAGHLRPGTYLLRIMSGEKVYVKKFVKI